MATASDNQAHQPQLGLWDAVSIIIGIIIGAGIYETPPGIFRGVTDAALAYSIWAGCGILVLVGALCYAELATTYPRDGGDYVYLTRAYGSLVGFLFGWTQLAVIQTASIGLMAYVFADYANRLYELPLALGPEFDIHQVSAVAYAGAAIIAVTLFNAAGVTLGKGVQNFLTIVKIIGLAGIVITAVVYRHHDDNLVRGTVVGFTPGQVQVLADIGYGRYDEVDEDNENRDYIFDVKDGTRMEVDFKGTVNDRPVRLDDFARNKHVVVVYERDEGHDVATLIRTVKKGVSVQDLMMILVFVLLTYGGWNDAAFVAAEVKDPSYNIPRALIFGTLGVMGIYLLINWAYVRALGFDAAQNSREIAADVLNLIPGGYGEQMMCVLVMISALGAINGLAFTSSRVYATLGADYTLFSWLGRHSPLTGAPVIALLLQMVISVAMVAGVAAVEGHMGGFFTILRCTAPVFWFFFLLTALSLFILRVRDSHLPRPFKVPAFPILPLIFVATCGYMFYSGIMYAMEYGLIGLALVVAGVPFYFLSGRHIPAPVPAVMLEPEPAPAAEPEPAGDDENLPPA